ncbi:unnamed protein product [Brachionus calyciflorus]|uniref:Uncharacterized protein n=1 Tax=Brachionus calyciflorus TaxID=104777 RepID=A0A813U281_9BILA|nr:unnamed protein product [Brachionus calyciflorus]
MYLRNQKFKKSNDKKALKPLNTTVYSKIKNKKRTNKKTEIVELDNSTPKPLSKSKNDEIEKYFLKKVGESSKNNLIPTIPQKSVNNENKKKSEFDLLNKYLDGTRITAFTNFLKESELPKINLHVIHQIECKQNNSIEKNLENLSSSTNDTLILESSKYSLDYLVQKFTEPFEKFSRFKTEKLSNIRKELRDIYESNCLDSFSKKDNCKKTLIDSEVQTSFFMSNDTSNQVNQIPIEQDLQIKKPSILGSSNFFHDSNKIQQISTLDLLYSAPNFSLETPLNSIDSICQKPLESKLNSFKKIKLEDLYYD